LPQHAPTSASAGKAVTLLGVIRRCRSDDAKEIHIDAGGQPRPTARKVSWCDRTRRYTQPRLAVSYRKEVDPMTRCIAHAAQIGALALALVLVPVAFAAKGGGGSGAASGATITF
jgi:hypothetical protein